MQSAFALSLTGRIPRKSYWVGILLSNAVAGFLDYLEQAPQLAVGGVVLAAFAYKLNLISRRLHDIGRSAWWQLPFVAPLGLALVASTFVTDEMISRFQDVTGASAGITLLTVGCIFWAFVLIVGVVPGSLSHKYGPPPPLEYFWR
jgi:uncharacterized membrane protein YhaH (DUF805 family)